MSLSKASTIGNAGLRAVAAETAVVARNITNAAATEHYSRRIAHVATTLGGGALVASITRATNQAVFANVLTSTASTAAQGAMLSGLDTLHQTIGSLSDLSSSAQSPAGLLSTFINALQAYSASPSDSNLASGAVSAAKALANALNTATDAIQKARAGADREMAASVETINSLLSQFEALNRQIVNGIATGSDVTDAQDRRDAALARLAEEIGISTVTGANGDIAIYTESGVTLFQGGLARGVTLATTNTFTASTDGRPVVANGIPITGGSSAMPVQSGKLAGLASLRDDLAVSYQAQLDTIAGALIDVFRERDQLGSGPDLPGLFTTPDAAAMPSAHTGLAGEIMVNVNADPSQGGNAELLRDGGISSPGDTGYQYNTRSEASFNGRIVELVENILATRTFGPGTSITMSASLSAYAAASVSWLEGERSKVSDARDYQAALLDTATAALSNSTGVSLDQEMSKMLDLEHSYAASAKLITAIDAMFDDLLNAI